MEETLPCVMVCVTEQTRCENLIHAGKKLADELGTTLEVLNIQPTKNAFKTSSEELQYLFNVVKKNQADMTVYYNDDPALVAACHIHKCNAVSIVVGLPGEGSSRFVETIRMLVPDVEINLAEDNGQMHLLRSASKEEIELAKMCALSSVPSR